MLTDADAVALNRLLDLLDEIGQLQPIMQKAKEVALAHYEANLPDRSDHSLLLSAKLYEDAGLPVKIDAWRGIIQYVFKYELFE